MKKFSLIIFLLFSMSLAVFSQSEYEISRAENYLQ